MHICNRWQNWCWSAGLALALAGCGQTEVPKVPNGAALQTVTPMVPQALVPAVVEPATNTPAVQPAAKPASPASLEEATRIIDFRKLPMPDGAKVRDANSVTSWSCLLRKGDWAQAVKFYRTKLAEAGWKLGDERLTDNLGIKEKEYWKEYWSFTATKQGFFLSGGAYEAYAAGESSVGITNYGNVDSRTLPRFAGAELNRSEFNAITYCADAKLDAVLEFTRTELKKGGWREVKLPARFNRKNEPGERLHLRFIQRGIQIATFIEVKESKTEVMYFVSFLRVELPIMAEAKGAVEFLDGEKSLLHLFYAAPTGPEKVLEFYKKELPEMGWTMRAGTDKVEYGKAKVILDSPGKESMRLELLADKEDTFVLFAAGPAAEKPGRIKEDRPR